MRASDGELGEVKDAYFDDHLWTARYLVVDTGGWLEERRVLISAISVENIDWEKRSVSVRLTRQQVKVCPNIDTDKPVSRQQEADFLGHYGYPSYWEGPFAWGTTSSPCPISRPTPLAVNDIPAEHRSVVLDSHLRSAREVRSYQLQATSSFIGHVDDFLVDDESWAMRYIVVDARDKHVVISREWITLVDWAERLVTVDVMPDTVRRAPEYSPAIEYSRLHETSLHRHYQRPGYWQLAWTAV
jgi:hypothetical protein